MAGINISFVSDVRSFIKGTDDIERAMDDVGDSLDDVSKDAKDAGDKIERSLSDAGKDAERSSEKMEKSFRKDFDKVEDKAKDAGDTIGKESKQGFAKAERAADDFEGKANEATGSFKDEAKANFAETASSFDGSMGSVVEMAQSTFGGMAGSAGPIGLLAGAGALAFGALYTSFQANAEAIEKRASDMYADLMESGQQFLSDSFIQAEVDKIVTGAEDAAISLADAKGMANDLGLNVSDVAAAFAGSAEAQDIVLKKIADQRSRMGELSRDTSTSYASEIMNLNSIERELLGQQGAIDGVTDKTAISRQAAYDYTTQYDDLKKSMDDSVGYYGGRTFTTRVVANADFTDFERQMRDNLSKRYAVDAYVNVRPGVSNW